MIIQGSPDILDMGYGLKNQLGGFGRAGLGAVLTAEKAEELLYRGATGAGGGVGTAEVNLYGGNDVVKAAQREIGAVPTIEWIQQYEIDNNLPESAHTLANKQYVGDAGVKLLALQETALLSNDAAIVLEVQQQIAEDWRDARAAVEERNSQNNAALEKALIDTRKAVDASNAEFNRIVAANAAAVAAASLSAEKAAVEARAYAAQTLAAQAAQQAAVLATRAAEAATAQRIAGEQAAAATAAAAAAATAKAASAAAVATAANTNAAAAAAAHAELERLRQAAATASTNAASTNAASTSSGGINPALILAAVAAYFFIG